MANPSGEKISVNCEQSNSEKHNKFSINVNKLRNYSNDIVQVKIWNKILNIELDTAEDVNKISEMW